LEKEEEFLKLNNHSSGLILTLGEKSLQYQRPRDGKRENRKIAFI